MNSVLERIRAASQRAIRPLSSQAVPSPANYQGYIDERSTHHVAGWLRNLDDAAERAVFEVVLAGADSDLVLYVGRADLPSETLVQVGVGDGRYAFRVDLNPPLEASERDRLIVRPAKTTKRLELAPALKTAPPGVPPLPTRGPFQGYIDERSVHHVAGWVRNLGETSDRVSFEVVLPEPTGERILHRGRADVFSGLLQSVGVGDGAYSFYVLFGETLSETKRDALFVRVEGVDHRLELAPALKSVFEPISHIAMDIVNNCNLRCPFCVYDYTNTKHTFFMSDATFEASLRLLPYVTDGNFWLSCLHEATLHPRLIEFIERVPTELRAKLFYTTNLAKRMPQSYFDFLANSGMHHLNISVESFDPAIYERMRKGARHRIFQENWEKLLAAWSTGNASPRLRYNLMAYRSNLHEIPGIVETLRRDKMAWQVEIRHTYDEPHIPADFRDAEFLTTEEWGWLAEALRGHDPEAVVLLLPPGAVGHDVTPRPAALVAASAAGPASEAAIEVMAQPPDDSLSSSPPGGRYDVIPRPLNISMDWDGTMRVYGEQPRGPGQPPTHVNYVMTNITYLKDPLRFVLAL